MTPKQTLSVALLTIILFASCDSKKDPFTTSCSQMIDPSIPLRYQQTLKAKRDVSVFGTSASTLYYEEGKYELPNGDSCSGITAHLTFGLNEFVGRVGKGSQFEGCAAKWLVTDITTSGAPDEGTLTLALLPDNHFPDAIAAKASKYQEVINLQGGFRNSMQTVDETDIILEALHPETATGASQDLDSLKIHIGKHNENITPVKTGTTFQTVHYTWTVIGLYLKNSNGRNYSRVVIAR